MAQCLHCKQKPEDQRGLCRACYRDTGVRQLYPRKPTGDGTYREPTAEEVEAVVAEQYPTMPDDDAKDDDYAGVASVSLETLAGDRSFRPNGYTRGDKNPLYTSTFRNHPHATRMKLRCRVIGCNAYWAPDNVCGYCRERVRQLRAFRKAGV